MLRSTAAQTDRAPENVESRPPSPQESVCTISESQHRTSQNVPYVKHSPHEPISRVQSPTEPFKKETQRLQTPPPILTTKNPNRSRTPSPDPTHSILKVTTSSCHENSSLQYKGENPQSGEKTEFNYNDTTVERILQQTQGQLSLASPEQDLEDTQTGEEAKHLTSSSMYKPAGPLSCFRPDPQPQQLVQWYSGTESPLSKVVLKPTRTHMIANIIVSQPQSPEENYFKDANNANADTKSHNVKNGKQSPPESMKGANISSDTLKKESQELQTSKFNTISIGSQSLTPSIEPIACHVKDVNFAEITRKEFLEPCFKSLNTNSAAQHSFYSSFQNNDFSEFEQDAHCASDRDTPELTDACDYLNTTVKYIKVCRFYIFFISLISLFFVTSSYMKVYELIYTYRYCLKICIAYQ